MDIEAHMSCGMRVGRATSAAGMSASEGLELLRAVSEELYPGVYETRALTAEEADAVATEIERRL